MDLHKKSMEHYKKAIDIYKQGKDPFKQLQLSAKMQLLRYKEYGVLKKVSILARGCDNCNKQNGKVFLIDEALKKMPIPNKNCSSHLFPRKNKKYSWCSCIWLPEVE